LSNYTKITDYAAKDALNTGDPTKLVKGTEIGADLDAVAVAVATKADTASPTLVTPVLGVATATSLQAIIGNVTPAAGTFTSLTATGAFTSLGLDDNATAKALTLSGSGANSVTIANSATNPTIGTSAGSLAISSTVAITGNAAASGQLQCYSGTAAPAGGTAGVGVLIGSSGSFGVFFGSGAPTLSAAKGSLYLRTDGTGTGDRMYVNTGTTNWTAVTTAG